MKYTPVHLGPVSHFPKSFAIGDPTYILDLEDLGTRFRIGEFKPLSDYIDFERMVYTLVLNKDQIEGWHLISPNMDPEIPDHLLRSIDRQITQLLNTLMSRYVSQVPTRRNQHVVPIHVTESALFLAAVPYDE